MSDIIMYFTYISPEGSTKYNNLDEKNGINILQNNFDSIMIDYPDARFILAGDMNARTKDFLDFIPADDVNLIFGEVEYNNSTFDMPRINKDSLRYNTFGRTLVNFCCSHDMHILNGRFNDHEGNYTCFSSDGASVVDYIIASEELFKNITFF